AFITREKEKIKEAKGIVLPGVGAFKDCVDNLNRFDLTSLIKSSIKEKKPFLGICLGLQLLFSYSEEGEGSEGFGIIKGKVKRFETDLKIPHMGWNRAEIKKESPLLKGVEDRSYLYFVHSYYVETEETEVILTETDYGIKFTSAISKDNIFATQFHPEKSQDIGLKILKNFSEIVGAV
ncbi:imidazole glycerol phosphate synthase subunit HisH, partial [Candidatus Auribacterota bacterium]